jgi:hypothetical protein
MDDHDHSDKKKPKKTKMKKEKKLMNPIHEEMDSRKSSQRMMIIMLVDTKGVGYWIS